jgi:EAL domain-containing protein (putative c-di-GMP-specific phosphodiesterase class I)
MTSKNFKTQLRRLQGGFNAAVFGDYEIRTAFQPIYTLDDDCSRLYGVEALARPLKNGIPIPPLDFFSELDPASAFEADWACLAVHLVNAAAWEMPSTRLFVNLNPTVCHLMIQSEDLFVEFAELANRLGMDPTNIVCEISEQRIGSDEALALLGRKLRGYGFQIAVDGFGPKTSNLIRVIELEPAIVKIDPDWLKAMIAQPAAHDLSDKMMHRLNDIGAEVLIQGVETAEEYRWARQCPASYVQGYLFGAATYLHDRPANTCRPPSEDQLSQVA